VIIIGLFMCVCLVNDGNGNDEKNEGRKKINQIECMRMCDGRDEEKNCKKP
jgi:hypothetical protein